MHDDAFTQTPLRRLLSTSWPLFRAFGVDVRISWTICVWPLLFTYLFWSFLDPGTALFFAVLFTLGLFTCVWTHEMGHILAGRRVGVQTDRMTLRGLGGLAHMQSRGSSPRDGIFISLAGPATHLLWIAVAYPAVWIADGLGGYGPWMMLLHWFAGLQLSFMIFNLLPFYALDGGGALMGFLALKMHPNKAALYTARVGFVGAALFILVGLAGWLGISDAFGFNRWGFFLIWIGIENGLACRRLTFEARHGDIYERLDPFQKVLRESEKLDEADRKEREKARKAREERAAERDRIQSTIDRLLDRINEVGGVENLNRSERRELDKASEALKRHDARSR